jgi:hypothetical protein
MNSNTLLPYRIVAFAFLLLAYPMSYLVADWWSWENGPLEILDNLVLLIGTIQAVALGARSPAPWKWLWLALVPVWIICLGREISWGAVFYSPTAMSADGPEFSARILLWYNPAIKPFAALLALISVFLIFRFKLWRLVEPLIRARQFPILEPTMAAASLILMTAAERHMGMSLDRYVGIPEVFEETVELAGYLFLLTAQQRIRIASRSDSGHRNDPHTPAFS